MGRTINEKAKADIWFRYVCAVNDLDVARAVNAFNSERELMEMIDGLKKLMCYTEGESVKPEEEELLEDTVSWADMFRNGIRIKNTHKV